MRVGRDAHINVLVAANRFGDEIERLCRAEGISHQQYVALWVLCLADEPEAGVPIGSLADGLLNRASDTTRLVDRMARDGLVERVRDDADRRVVLVRPTERGTAAFESATAEVKAYHRRQWKALTAGELDELARLLDKVLWSDGHAVERGDRR